MTVPLLTPPEGCCQCCGVELGESKLKLGVEPEAVGMPGICQSCAWMIDEPRLLNELGDMADAESAS